MHWSFSPVTVTFMQYVPSDSGDGDGDGDGVGSGVGDGDGDGVGVGVGVGDGDGVGSGVGNTVPPSAVGMLPSGSQLRLQSVTSESFTVTWRMNQLHLLPLLGTATRV